jgi:Mg-chelatase subunit ChlD
VVAAWLLERGLASVGDLERRRRDIRRAQALLETGALEEEATALRRRAARDRAWERGLPMPRPGWEEQAAWAERMARKSPAQVYQALRIQFLRALEAGQTERALRLRSALEAFRLEPAGRGLRAVAPPPSEEARRGDDVLAELLLEAPEERLPLLDIGRAAARVVAWDQSPAEEDTAEDADVRHIAPDRRLELALTSRPSDVQDFVIEDPRRLVHDLASGGQRVRRLVGGTAPRRARRTRARVYLCDASGSMRGGRARLRDALLVAELDTLRRQALDGIPVDPLDLCFFGDRSLRFERIDSAEAARVWLERLLAGGPCAGMTELSAALVGAAEWLATARRRDRALVGAMVTVITDGEDAVDLAGIAQAWEALRGLPVSLRVVCLGEENRWLKGWVQDLRSRGGDAGWLHLDDAELAGVPGDFDFRPPTLLPGPECVVGVDLERLRPHLEALTRVSSDEEPPIPPVDGLRFDAFFPEPDPTAAGVDDAWAADALEALVEAATLAPFQGRASEAVLLLEHLVSQRGLPMAVHLTRHARPGPRTAEALRRIRLLCRPAG